MRKIAVVTGSRAEYGILLPVLRAIEKSPRLELQLIVSGMYLSHEFGYAVKEIIKDGFRVAAKVDTLLSDDTGGRMAKSIGIGILGITQVLEGLKPDIVLVLGDREEPLAAAISGLCLGIPVAHIVGGEIATGAHIDEAIRHSITKFSHLHLVISKKNKERVLKLGEESWRVHLVGSPVIDSLGSLKLIPSFKIAKKLRLDLSKPVILVVLHPLSLKQEDYARQIKEVMEAVNNPNYRVVVIYPNADAAGRKMIEVIKQYEKLPFIRILKNLSPKEYLSLMKIASVMVGNSSSGILEAPSFHLPVINVGIRQKGREKAKNIIDTGYSRKKIKKAIEIALYDKAFKKIVKKCKNPYAKKGTSRKITQVLERIPLNERLLHKKITY
ncbi:MAG: UDP-N-acetylglucosamine 2-epimerase (hydrolyzing) [Parcubacteria group bacterium]|nr:UDP-N-acetylglucosamine 2-epimerase (hydrolyzing) [Parcubacteria group bacterium]|tara:strand:- start:10364 stop:11515 length:1152 start_codon:yes stop_codon:yes gene_type:complete